jgi:hypothetical protein
MGGLPLVCLQRLQITPEPFRDVGASCPGYDEINARQSCRRIHTRQ